MKNWITLLYSRNQHNIVNQLYFNKKNTKTEKSFYGVLIGKQEKAPLTYPLAAMMGSSFINASQRDQQGLCYHFPLSQLLFTVNVLLIIPHEKLKTHLKF